MWGLLGLKLCLEARGDAPDELAAVTALFNERSSRVISFQPRPASVLKMHLTSRAVTDFINRPKIEVLNQSTSVTSEALSEPRWQRLVMKR